jgi:cerevisin
MRLIDTQSFFKGLARISHRPKLSRATFAKYEYQCSGGEGIDVYVIDTGIDIKHEEFEGRASWGKTIPVDDDDDDDYGHGTHCAGTIASRKYGVAMSANVIAVKVLGSNGSGSMSDVIAGVLYAHKPQQRRHLFWPLNARSLERQSTRVPSLICL